MPARNTFGFTLIELLVVISLMAIITGAIIPSFNTYIKNQNALQAVEQVKNDLRTVQNRALTGEDSNTDLNSPNKVYPLYWGIRFVNNTANYTYFVSTTASGCLPAVSSTRGTSRKLPGGLVVKNSSGDKCIFFSNKNGDGSFSGTGAATIIVGEQAASTGCRRLMVQSSGLIQVDESNTSCS